MKLFPESASYQLEFDKIKNLLIENCRTEYASEKAASLQIHTRKDIIDLALQQTNEYKLVDQGKLLFPSEPVVNISREIKLLGINGAMLSGEQFLQVKKLAVLIQSIFRWFDEERRQAYPGLAKVVSETYYEKLIIQAINQVLDDAGIVKDNASAELASIRLNLYRKRNELRRLFDKVVSRMNKQGFLADIEESFINGRRVLAVFAEQKRMVKGILHGESDSRRTSFIEPEETTDLNNTIFSLEHQETREVYKILRELTAQIGAYSSLLGTYLDVVGEYDFIRAKAKLAKEMNGNYPAVFDQAGLNLKDAYHPLLYLYGLKTNKPAIPVSLTLNEKNRILVISGPNAGGKTVTMKTVGLLQMMVQSGLLVPVNPDSSFGIFKQLMIHIGDTQSLEFELSTYSSHLKNMKYFMENANGKTLFFIDELGSGSDPNLGGAFAEVIMEELAKKHATGIVTTHYLNLKVMANKVAGIINGAMAFDEQNLKPLYRLIVGKPGSSYTFSIAERIGLHHSLINKAKQLVDEGHFSLDKLLNRTEQDLQKIDKDTIVLQQLLKENERLKKQMEKLIAKEEHLQQVELLKHQNKVSEEKLTYLKDMERNIKALVIEWRKTDDKDQVIKMMHALLFKQREKHVADKQQKKLNEKYFEVDAEIKIGEKVKMKNSRQVGVVRELRGKKAILQVGVIPITVDLADLVVVRENEAMK